VEKVIPGIGIVILAVVLSTCGASWAAEKKPGFLGKTGEAGARNADQPLRITSQQLEADNKRSVIIFSGNVVAKQGNMTIYADSARVYYEKKEEGNEIREIVATGNVKIQEAALLAIAQNAVFTNSEQKIVLTGQPKIWQGKDMVSGEKITILLEENKSFVESGPERRVEVILYPREEPRPGKRTP
jgi:lipopolysaccharide export system protein LptA